MRAFLKKKQRRILLLLVTIILCVLTRTLFLDTSARFIWDESGDLVRMHEIFKEKKVTLIGPISQDKINVYGSLTYYMFLPFALLFQFDPIGPVIGAAFYSLVSIFLLAVILWKKFGWNLVGSILFLSFIFPFLQAGRWAWNPNLVPFWQILSLFVYFSVFLKSKRGIWLFFSGFLQSLAVHNHWYAVFALAGFSVFVFLTSPRQKKWCYFLIFLTGVSVGLAPFLVFDLTHPPGLFITRMIYFSPLSLSQGAFSMKTFFLRSISLPYQFLFYFFQERLISWLMLILLLLFFLKERLVKNLLLLPLFFLFIGLSLIGGEVYQHYFLSGVVFLVIWLFYCKKSVHHSCFQKLIILLFFVFSIKPSISELLKNDWSTNIAATRKIVMTISSDIESRNCNLVVVASPDLNTKGKRYRDLLFLKGINLLPEDNYRDNECLYVVSSSDEATIRKDPAYELDRIRNMSATKEWQIKNSIWNVYRFDIK
ncbi:hypothetical protein KKI19_00735 [Patescibacteria group bacterium]|nr:hypothetical protein [Patescibacteria group bacterium]